MRPLIRYSMAWLFGYRDVPLASRAIFRHELMHMCCWAFVWGSINGGFCGYLALRSFDASDFLVSVITAAMAFANLFAVWWGVLARRMPRNELMVALLGGVAVLLFSFALTPLCQMLESNSPPSLIARLSSPSHPLTAAVFALQVVLLWIAVQGTNTVRTSIWKNNYPDACRGRILARFAIWQMLIGSLWVAGMGAYLDGKFTVWLGSRQLSMDLSWLYGAGDASAYRYLFPLTGVACIISLVFFKRMKVRRDWVALNGVVADRSGTESVEPNYAIPGWFATRWGVLRSGLGDALAILKGDRVFRKYMGWMFLSGSSIMMIQVPLLLILKDKFDVSYLQAAGLLTFVPQIALVLSTPLWARWFDAWPLFLFRAVQVGVWVVNRLVLAIAVFQASMPIVVAAAAISGVALAGGRFAWHLGHMEFSDTTNDSSYLGVHQTFTGLRGLLMPFVGAALYRYCFDWHVIWVSGVLLILAAGGYWRMYVRYQAHSGSSSEP